MASRTSSSRSTPSRSTPSGSSSGSSSSTRVGKYELGKTLGEGTFAKVKFARNVENGESVAIKVIDKEKVLKTKMIAQIKREISTMKLIKHPNVIRMFEVMASKTKIYFVLEFVTGGELFDKISSSGRLKEDEARKYFQQLINAVDYCHSRGVYHRDLKPENLLLDANGTLKVSDFGLSALPQQVREDGLLHTTCGTPNYVAPEVINNKGYDGAKADLWSCGVILFVLMAGYLPFEDSNLTSLYKKIFKAEFTCPPWFSASAKKLIKRILDPSPATRITFAEVIENEWFKKGYKAPKFENANVSLDDVDAIFDESGESKNLVVERRAEGLKTPVTMNAFELISTSQGLNLGSLFEKQMGLVKRKTQFTSKCPANEIVTKIEAAAAPMGFDVKKNNYKMKLLGEKSGRKGQLAGDILLPFSGQKAPFIIFLALSQRLIMDAVTASLSQSPVLLPRTSKIVSGSIFMTASSPGFMRFGSGPQFRHRHSSSLQFSRPLQSRTISLQSRRSFVVRASASDDVSDSIAPLQLKSPVGQFLSQILVSHPHLMPAAVEQQLEQLQTDRDAEEKIKDASSVPGTDIVLYRRIAEVKEKERRRALEEILYALVVQKFMDANVSLVPSISSSSSGRVDTWPTQDGELEQLHSPEVFEMIQNHLSVVLKNRVGDLTAVAQISKLGVGQVYAASVMYGYFLKRIDQRFQLEKTMKILPGGSDETETSIEQAGRETEISLYEEAEETYQAVSSNQEGGINASGGGFSNEMKQSRLKTYVMSFDGETLQRYATIRSREAIGIIEKHTEALFGRPEIVITPQGTIDSSKDEHVKMSFKGLKRLVLEAVTFGSFLWDVESHVDSRYHFVLN